MIKSKLTFRQILQLLELQYFHVQPEDRLPVLVVGRRGFGKSAVVRAFARKVNLPVLDIRLAGWEPQDLQGVPKLNDSGSFSYAQYEKLLEVTERPAVLFFDEVLQADPGPIKALFRILLDRELLDGTKFHPGTAVVLAGNDSQKDNWVVSLKEAFLDRLMVVELVFNFQEWVEDTRPHPLVVGFLRAHQEYIGDKDGALSPRRWTRVSEALVLEGKGIQVDLLLRGLLGDDVFSAFSKWKAERGRLFSVAASILHTGSCSSWGSLPQAEKLEVVNLVAEGVSPQQLDNVVKFLEELNDEWSSVTAIAVAERVGKNFSAVECFTALDKLRKFLKGVELELGS